MGYSEQSDAWTSSLEELKRGHSNGIDLNLDIQINFVFLGEYWIYDWIKYQIVNPS